MLRKALSSLFFVIALLVWSAVTEVVEQKEGSSSFNSTANDSQLPQERNLKNHATGSSHSQLSDNEETEEAAKPLTDYMEEIKDDFLKDDKNKYNQIGREYEKLTLNFNLLGDEDSELFSEILAPGTSLHIPLHPTAIKHMIGKRVSPKDERPPSLDMNDDDHHEHDRRLSKHISSIYKKMSHKGNRKKAMFRNPRERILIDLHSHSPRRQYKQSSEYIYTSVANKKWNKAFKKFRHHFKRNVDGIDVVRRRASRIRRLKIGPDSGGDGIVTATAAPQLFDSGITVHNYGPSPSAHPLFMDMLDQDNQPKYIDATITIPPPRLLEDQALTNH